MKKLFIIVAVIMAIGTGGAFGTTEDKTASAPEDVSYVDLSSLEDNLLSEYDEQGEKTNSNNMTSEGGSISEKAKSEKTDIVKAKANTKTSEKKDSAKQKTSIKTSEKTDTASKKVNKQKEEPKHTHSWTAIYATKQVPHTKQVAWTKCYCCGADMTGNPEHIGIHLDNHESNVHYGTEYRTETYYTTEQYVSGYRCSCGATK